MGKSVCVLIAVLIAMLSFTACSTDAPDSAASSYSASLAVSEVSDSTVSKSENPYALSQVNVWDNLDKFTVMGRYCPDSSAKQLCFDNAANALRFTADCEGKITAKLHVRVAKDGEDNKNLFFTVKVDGEVARERIAAAGSFTGNTVELELAAGLERGEHTVEFIRESSSSYGTVGIICIGLNGKLLTPPENAATYIEFVGDGLTVGRANLFERNKGDKQKQGAAVFQNALKSYSAVVAETFGADFGIVARDDATVSEMADSLYLRSSVARNSQEWGFIRKPDVIVVNLGTNDYAKIKSGELTYEQFQKDVRELITLIRATNPEAKIVYAYGIFGVSRKLGEYAKRTFDNMGGEKRGYYFCDMSGRYNLSEYYPTVKEGETFARVLSDFLVEKCGLSVGTENTDL